MAKTRTILHRGRRVRTHRFSILRVARVTLLIVAISAGGLWMLAGQPDVVALLTPDRSNGARAVADRSTDPAIVETVAAPPEQPDAAAKTAPWTCIYSVTEDHDWHNDVTCFNGIEAYRPHLLPDHESITADEMIAAGRAHEEYLNAGGAR